MAFAANYFDCYNEERETVLFDFLGARTQKDDIGHHFEQTDYVSAPKNEDTGSEKDDIGHRFEQTDYISAPKIEDTGSENDDIGHHFEQTDYVSAPKMENTGSEKDDIGHHFEADNNTSPEPPDIQMQARSPSTESKSKENGSVLIFKDGMFIPNKIQVIEEHESYTVFKVFAVKQ